MLATDTDAKLALLASVFEDVPTKELREALEKCNGVVEHAIDLMLSRRGDLPGDDQPKTSEKRLPKRLKEDLQQQRNAFDLLQQPSGPKGRMELFATDIERFLPCRLVEDFLPRDLALSLLDEMLQEASEWKTRKFNLFDRDVESPHTTCFYMDETRKPRKGLIPDEDESIVVDSSVAGIPGQKSSHRPFFLDLARVRDLIETFVQKDMAARKRDPLEIQGLWKPNIVVANCYRGHDQGVGQHADRLTYIGPRPTIASLTLGAKRAFRIRKIQQGDGSPARFYDVKLPHNSLLIMSPPMQEEYKHEIPKCQPTGITPHPKAKDKRINLTFRVARQEYCDAVPRCKCNVPTDLRVVSKKEQNYGRYFYICAGKGNAALGLASGYSCGFFQWLVVPKPCSQDASEQTAPICID